MKARTSEHRRRCARDRGQSTVELALLLPFVVLALLAIVQVGLVVHDQVLLTHAAREAARAAAVDADPDAASRAAAAGGGLDPRRLRVVSSGRAAAGSTVHVQLTYASPTDVAGIGPLIPDLDLRAEATMRVEQ